MLPVAILGTDDLYVTTIDPDSISLVGVAPMHHALDDVATPFEPFMGKTQATDCTTAGPDGNLDLTLKFDQQAVIQALEADLGRPLQDGEVITVPLMGNLFEEYDGTPIKGEDVINIRKKGKP